MFVIAKPKLYRTIDSWAINLSTLLIAKEQTMSVSRKKNKNGQKMKPCGIPFQSALSYLLFLIFSILPYTTFVKHILHPGSFFLIFLSSLLLGSWLLSNKCVTPVCIQYLLSQQGSTRFIFKLPLEPKQER